jgi:hypothetical protein
MSVFCKENKYSVSVKGNFTCNAIHVVPKKSKAYKTHDRTFSTSPRTLRGGGGGGGANELITNN